MQTIFESCGSILHPEFIRICSWSLRNAACTATCLQAYILTTTVTSTKNMLVVSDDQIKLGKPWEEEQCILVKKQQYFNVQKQIKFISKTHDATQISQNKNKNKIDTDLRALLFSTMTIGYKFIIQLVYSRAQTITCSVSQMETF